MADRTDMSSNMKNAHKKSSRNLGRQPKNPAGDWIDDKVASLKAGRDRVLEFFGNRNERVPNSPKTTREHEEFRDSRFKAYDDTINSFNQIPAVDVPSTKPGTSNKPSVGINLDAREAGEIERASGRYANNQLKKGWNDAYQQGREAGRSGKTDGKWKDRTGSVRRGKRAAGAALGAHVVGKGLKWGARANVGKSIYNAASEYSDYNKSRYEDLKKHYKRNK